VSLADLHRLEEAWSAKFPRQAGGGEAAIAGFHYQFLQVLLETARAWIELPADQRSNPTVLSERLSDIANATGPHVVVTQVKYTQSSGMVTSALGDLWRIYQVASSEMPDLLERLRFRILSARASLVDVDATIRRWRPQDIGAEDPQLVDFRARVEHALHSDPENDLLALLANELRAQSPLAIVHAWLGRLLEAAREPDGYERAAREIWNTLHELDQARGRQPATGIHVWTTRDRPPGSVRPGSFLTGEQPLVKHLREGFFAPRPDLFEPLADRVTAWLSSNPAATDKGARLPFYWLAGRSGAGKSVALLHVLALLHERGHGPILWLGNRVANLPAAIRYVHEVRRKDHPVVIAIDDPYAPATQGDMASVRQEALAELQESRESGDASSLPLIVCCGPTEQAERLRDEWSSDALVTIDPLGKESTPDLTALRAWYRARAGQDAPDIGDENVLLVQLFFQWRAGISMGEFANRFRRRIQAADPTGGVERALARMLALNRLYVGYCTGAFNQALSPEQRDVVARLRHEEHLAEDVVSVRSGLWLAHPHLADAIYEAWHPAGSSKNVRKDHLRAGILDALRSGASLAEETAPLWGLSGAFGQDAGARELAQRVRQTDIGELLEETYGHLGGARMPQGHLPVWIQLRVRVPGLALKPDPVAEAIDRLRSDNVPGAGLRYTCHKLLEHYHTFDSEIRTRVVDALVSMLGDALDWQDWPHVATHACRATADGRLPGLIAKWLASHEGSRLAPRILWSGLRCAPTSPELLQAGRQFLATVSIEHGAWGVVWEALWRGHEGDAWLNRLAREWLAKVPVEQGSWKFVWEALWERQEGDVGLDLLARDWLAKAPPAHGSWTFVWERSGNARRATPRSASSPAIGSGRRPKIILRGASFGRRFGRATRAMPRSSRLLANGSPGRP
jgi:hypothetical protein